MDCPECGRELREVLKPDYAPQRWMCVGCGYVTTPTPPPPAAQAIAELERRLDAALNGHGKHLSRLAGQENIARDAIALCKQLAGEG